MQPTRLFTLVYLTFLHCASNSMAESQPIKPEWRKAYSRYGFTLGITLDAFRKKKFPGIGEEKSLLAVSSGLFGVEAGLVYVMGMLLFGPQRRPSFHPDPQSSDAVVHSSCQGWPAR